ncbi:MAG: membrane protein insertase YidC [Flavobacteriales bacterium]|nr:membrane protein insertase YidC [Flavobacteriales bacterium]
MDKNTFVGLLLIGAIIIGFSIYNAPSEEEVAEQLRVRDSIEQVEAEKAAAMQAQQTKEEGVEAEIDSSMESVEEISNDSTVVSNDSVQNAELERLYGAFAASAEGESRIIKVENELMKLYFNTKGGKVEKVELKDYVTYSEKPLLLIDSTSDFNFNFFTRDNKNIYTDELYFTTDVVGDMSVSGSGEQQLSFRLNAGSGRYLELLYTIRGDQYLIDLDVNLIEMDQVVDMRTGEMYLNWSVQAPDQEKTMKNQRDATTIYYKFKDEDIDYLTATSDEKEEFDADPKWISLKQQFFNTTIIADDAFDKARAFIQTETDEGSERYVKRMTAALTLPLSGSKVEQYGMSFYFGPNKYDILKELDLGLEEIIDLGWGIFGWVNRFAVIPVFNFLDSFDMSYGIIILILTILLKLVLSPITYKTYLSGAKMRVLKPEINEINEKYKDDAMKKQQEMMSLYRQTGVNPLSGCIPLLIQMPILIAMFRFFPASIELRQESFLWADDLSTYDSIYTFPDGFSIPFYGDHISLFTILMAVSIALYTKLNSSMSAGMATEGPMAAQMKIMMYLMPIMMLFWFNSYSSGLSYYYFLANIISIGQTFLIRKVFINEDAIRAKIEKNKKNPKKKKKSGFAKRMEEMAKQQQLKQKGK